MWTTCTGLAISATIKYNARLLCSETILYVHIIDSWYIKLKMGTHLGIFVRGTKMKNYKKSLNKKPNGNIKS